MNLNEDSAMSIEFPTENHLLEKRNDNQSNDIYKLVKVMSGLNLIDSVEMELI